MKKKREKSGMAKKVLMYMKPWRGRYLFGLLALSADSYMKSLLVGLFIGGMLSLAQAGSFAGVLQEAGKWLGLMAAWLSLAAVGKYALADASRRSVAALKRDLYKRMLCAPYQGGQMRHSGDLLSRLDSDAQMCQSFMEQIFVDVSSTLFSIVLGVLTVWKIHWSVALVLSLVGFIMMGVNSVLTRYNKERYKEEAKQRGETVAHMGELLAGSSLVRIYGEDTGLMQRFIDSCKRLFALSMRSLNIRSCYNGINQVNAGLTLAGSLGLGLVLYQKGVISLTTLPLLIQMGTTVVSPIAGLGWVLDRWNEMAAGIGRVGELLAQKQEEDDEEREENGTTVLSGEDFAQDAGGPLEAVAVSATHMNFSYEVDNVALKDVDLSIPAGSVYGIVGYSGSGKSTFLRLLMGMGDYGGSLRVFGQEVRDMPLHKLRDLVAYVPQECPLFEGTIYENIRLGRQAAGREEVLACARAADVEEFVEKMPQGYETMVGERGVNLSGGQRQRIAIARAMLKDAPILLLDEVTAALDSVAQQRIEASLKRLMAGRTTLIVAHRLSNVVEADRILVFDKGCLVEEGSHRQLLEKEGIYARLYRLQTGNEAWAN